MRALCIALSLAAFNCQRVDEPAPTPPSATPQALQSAPALKETSRAAPVANSPPRAKALAATDAPRCIEPLIEPPPPPEEPASICPHDPDDKPPVLRHGTIQVPAAKGALTLDVEIADTPPTEERGLMYRTKLGAEQGMIFVWPKESIRTFWMHNTCLPLDMLFIAKDGTVAGLLEQVPTLNDRPRQVHCPAAYVLEVNAGWSRRHGVKPGMKLDIKL